jgi:hypothetical protein
MRAGWLGGLKHYTIEFHGALQESSSLEASKKRAMALTMHGPQSYDFIVVIQLHIGATFYTCFPPSLIPIHSFGHCCCRIGCCILNLQRSLLPYYQHSAPRLAPTVRDLLLRDVCSV